MAHFSRIGKLYYKMIRIIVNYGGSILRVIYEVSRPIDIDNKIVYYIVCSV